VTTLLAIGDMHLGRPPSAIPEDLDRRRDALGPEAAWTRCVELALNRNVDAVLLAGDLVDQGRDFFVGYGQLKAGIEQLVAAGIPVLAVAGNHDTHILPRLADEIDGLELLGAGGEWETRRLGNLDIVGWSFPREQVRQSPLPKLGIQRGKHPVIGLLHCDLDQADSPYAPVSTSELEATPVSAWLLGHIHRPDRLDGDRPIGYLGSVTALRASETGPRGPWLLQVGKQKITAEHQPLAPMRYEAIEIDCTELDDAAGLGERILAGTRDRIHGLAEHDEPPLAVGFRITLTGQSGRAGEITAAAGELVADGRSWDEAGIACFIQKIESALLPKLDLKRLARQSDPRGLLARRLLALEAPDSEEYERLVQRGREAMRPLIGSREFRDLDQSLDDDTVATWLKRASRLALIRLTDQHEDAR
jgi:DNA repair protein SbcD/Mre11